MDKASEVALDTGRCLTSDDEDDCLSDYEDDSLSEQTCWRPGHRWRAGLEEARRSRELPTTYTVPISNSEIPTTEYPPGIMMMPNGNLSEQTQCINNIDKMIRLVVHGNCWACFTVKDGILKKRFNRYAYYSVSWLEVDYEDDKELTRIAHNPKYLIEENDQIIIYMLPHYGYKLVATRRSDGHYDIEAFKCSDRWWE